MASQAKQSYVDELLDMSEPEVDLCESEIVQFFTGRNVLITGASGFLGRLVVEKLLRVCPNIGKLYMFMRPKKGNSTEERFIEYNKDVVFSRLRKEQPRYQDKIIVIEADTGKLDLGLSPESRMLLRDTEIVFHGAATVHFDEKIRIAVNINVRGTKQLLLLAREMPNLKAFVHISTAFSHCVHSFIEEKFYTPPIEPDKLLLLLDALDDDQLALLRPSLLGSWPNTYAFTKAVAESVVQQYSDEISTCIIRPSIVISTWREPLRGWTNNLYGATGVVVGAAIGLLRTIHCKESNIADVIPADFVVSNIIAAAWDTAQQRSIPRSLKDATDDTDSSDTNEVAIYNCVSSCQNPITWGLFMKQNEMYGSEVPSERALWHYMFSLHQSLFLHRVSAFFLHLLPAAIVDTVAYLTGRQPILLKAYKKVHKFSDVIAYFCMREWHFCNERVLKLRDKMNSKDRTLFNIDLSNFDWEDYAYMHIRGLRIYIAKDPIETLEAGRRKYKRLKYLHYTLVTIFKLLLLWLFLWFLSYLWHLCPLSN